MVGWSGFGWNISGQCDAPAALGASYSKALAVAHIPRQMQTKPNMTVSTWSAAVFHFVDLFWRAP